MKIVQLKSDDERFGHKAGDLFVVEDADYDDDKYVGVKIVIEQIDNAFYKDQMRNAGLPQVRQVAEKAMAEFTKGNEVNKND